MHSVSRQIPGIGEVEGPCPCHPSVDSEKISIVFFQRSSFVVSLQVSDNDRNVVEFYGSQAETYAVYLSNAIDAFILTIEHSQPPKVFVAYSKFVILNAHKLLCIGDTVHRNVDNVKLKAVVLERSNQLCQVQIKIKKKRKNK